MRVKREVSWPAVIVVTAAVAVVALCGYLLVTWPPDPPAASPASVRHRVATPSPSPAKSPVVSVLGDSFTALSVDGGPTWPQIVGDDLGWTMNAAAVDGSGYVAASGGKPLGARLPAVVRQSPSVVIVAAGSADVTSSPPAAVVDAAGSLLDRLEARLPDAKVVLVSPFSVGSPGPRTAALSSGLERLAKKRGVAYVDVSRWLGSGARFVAPDGVHLTDAGQQRVAKRMEKALTDLGVAGS